MTIKERLIIVAIVLVSISISTTQASAAVRSVNNNFTMLDSAGGVKGGANDVVFTWDGTKKTAVAQSGQVSNATLSSVTPFYGITWSAHDVAVYGPGTYTVYSNCDAASPGCENGTKNGGAPITFTVGAGDLGAHILLDWGGSTDIDVVNVWTPNSAFGPSPLYTGPNGTTPPAGNPATVWSWMSKDGDGNGINGYGMVDGPFMGFRANFNVHVVGTTNNNFTLLDSEGRLTGGANDVVFTWNGTRKTSVVVSGQVPNATLSSVTPFSTLPWTAHDVAVYGPGTYTVYAGCPAGGPGCGKGTPIIFTVGAGQLGAHILLDWADSTDMDIVDVWAPSAVFGPSPLYTGPDGGTVSPSKIWDWMSRDWKRDGKNGVPMVDGSLPAGFRANFNVMGKLDLCSDAPTRCNDNNACTTDTCNALTGICIHTARVCDDNNACTTDTCNPATGCVFTPPGTCSVYSTNNNFTMVDPTGEVTGGTNDVVFAWDGSRKTSVAASGQISNAVISSTCPSQGSWAVHDVAIYGPGTYTVYADCPAAAPGCGAGTAITFTVGANELGAHMLFDWGTSLNSDVVDVWAPKAAFAPSAMWTKACGSNPARKIWDWMSKDWDKDGISGRKMVDGPSMNFSVNVNVMGVPPPARCSGKKVCNDDNACTTDTCTGGSCVYTPIICNDNNACTTDSCNRATGCVFTPISCDDGNACTDDTCFPATGCVHTPKVCNDNNACTTDSCNTATGACEYTAVICPGGVCQNGKCVLR